MSVYTKTGVNVSVLYDFSGDSLQQAYNIYGTRVFPDLPVPAGDLSADSVVALPDLYEAGNGFTCTGLAYDKANNRFLVGDIGILQPNGGTVESKIVILSSDFSTVVSTIPVYSIFSGMGDIQGITIDESDNTIWFCAPTANKIYHTNFSGAALGSISVTGATGIAYNSNTDSLWVLTYNNKILHLSKSGSVLETNNFAYSETLDQCFLDVSRGHLYITAGTNYSSRNNVYLFDINTHSQSVACTVDSYSVEGIWIGESSMIILNDGYYHSALVAVNQANIYDI